MPVSYTHLTLPTREAPVLSTSAAKSRPFSAVLMLASVPVNVMIASPLPLPAVNVSPASDACLLYTSDAADARGASVVDVRVKGHAVQRGVDARQRSGERHDRVAAAVTGGERQSGERC